MPRLKMNTTKVSDDKDVDLFNASRGVWLVKVPKYIADKWEKAPNNVEVGKLKVERNVEKSAEVTLSLAPSLAKTNVNIPSEYSMKVSNIRQQTLGVFSQRAGSNDSSTENEKIAMEGKIVKKLECIPKNNNDYLKMKLRLLKSIYDPIQKTKQLEKIVHTYKPVADHDFNLEYAERRRVEGKRTRNKKDVVMSMLFAAFEKHQYYHIRDLVRITNQPVIYLKEVLKEVGNYNTRNPHKSMWELKPEYRCYRIQHTKDGTII